MAMSLRSRVTLASIGVLGLGLAIVGVALNLVLANRLSADASSVLRERAASQLATLDTSGPRLAVHDAAGDAVLDQQAWVFDLDGRIVERPPADDEESAMAMSLSRVSAPRERSIDERARLLGVPAYAEEGNRRVGTVVVGISLAPYERTEHLVALGTALLSLLVLAASALLARRAVDAALRPVASMTSQAAQWGERDLHRRFALGPPRDELTGLAATLDGLLGRLDAALRHEQRFSAEVAHELRTPLSGLRGEAELALRGDRSDAELRMALERVLAATDRMAAVIDTLLAAARSEATGPPGSSDAAGTVRQLAGARVEVVTPPGPVTVGADQELVAAAVQPLLENALRHAQHDVRIEVRRAGAEVVISVNDDGPGVAPADAERIFAPGFSRAGGAGLGLALSRRLARAAGGDVVVAGSGFELRLPSTALD
jgi:two-component system OmpR family sensor kinase